MPIYEYTCDECSFVYNEFKTVEEISRIPEPDEFKRCLCTNKMQLVISSPSIRFKGPGFMATDVGPGPRYLYSTPAKTRMRQEVKDDWDRKDRDRRRAERQTAHQKRVLI